MTIRMDKEKTEQTKEVSEIKLIVNEMLLLISKYLRPFTNLAISLLVLSTISYIYNYH